MPITRNRFKVESSDINIDDVEAVVVGTFGIEIDHKVGNEAYFLCPVHDDHVAKNASVNLDNGYWKCFSCSAGGDIISLGSNFLKCSRYDILDILMPTTTQAKLVYVRAKYKKLKERCAEIQANEASGFQDRIHDPSEFAVSPLKYMYDRGFSDETMSNFNVRYGQKVDVKTKTAKSIKLLEVVCIPVHDHDGKLAGWCFRSTDKSPKRQPRYFYTTGMKMNSMIFNEHATYGLNARTIVVTEGPIDAMWIEQEHGPAVAVYGASGATSPHKVELLSNYREIVILGDRDGAGLRFTNKLGDLLSEQVNVRVAMYRKSWPGKDPNELAPEQLRYALINAQPFHLWRLNDRTR